MAAAADLPTSVQPRPRGQPTEQQQHGAERQGDRDEAARDLGWSAKAIRATKAVSRTEALKARSYSCGPQPRTRLS